MAREQEDVTKGQEDVTKGQEQVELEEPMEVEEAGAVKSRAPQPSWSTASAPRPSWSTASAPRPCMR